MHLGCTATHLDADRRLVAVDDGTVREFDYVVVATGSVNRRSPVRGIDLAGVHQLRTIAEADALRNDAGRASSAVIVGQAFIGCEVAATLRTQGLDVTMVDPQPGPLYGPLGPDVNSRVARWHRCRKVALINDVGIKEITRVGRVDGVVLDDGRALEADLVVVGVGATRFSWLADSGPQMDRGAVLVDAQGRSSIPGLYAAGDVSAWCDDRLGQHGRVEHYDSALDQDRRLAHTIVGSAPEARSRSWFWSDQYDHALQYSGAQQPGQELLWRGGTGFWLRGKTVTAVVSLDDGRTFRRAMALIDGDTEPPALLDERVDLRTLRRNKQPAAAPA